MSTLQNLVAACQADEALLREQAQSRTENWQSWLTPVSDANPTGEDPGYDDDFQRIREEVNKLSGIDTGLICQLAEKLLTSAAKDIRVATYYCWARLHQDGEAGFAEGLELLGDYCSAMVGSFTRSVTAAVKQHWSGWRVPVSWTVFHFTRKSCVKMHSVPLGRCCSSVTAWKLSRKHHGRS
jgi:hypothetical protein